MGITSCQGGASRVPISVTPRVGSGLPPGSSNRLWSLALATITQQAFPQPRRCQFLGLLNVQTNSLRNHPCFKKQSPNFFSKDSWQPSNRGIQHQLHCSGLPRAELPRLLETQLLRSRIIVTCSTSQFLRFVVPGGSQHRDPSISASGKASFQTSNISENITVGIEKFMWFSFSPTAVFELPFWMRFFS